MDIVFQTNKLQKICNDQKELIRTYGVGRGKLVGRRLVQLRAAANLEELRNLPQLRCHELKADRDGQLAVDVLHPFRLIFEPANAPVPTKPDGGLDWSKVTAVRIIEVVDYHG